MVTKLSSLSGTALCGARTWAVDVEVTSVRVKGEVSPPSEKIRKSMVFAVALSSARCMSQWGKSRNTAMGISAATGAGTCAFNPLP